MAKYHITHTCGHQVTHQIVGTNKNGQRDHKITWLASRLCYDCYKAEKQAAADQLCSDLPALTGSPKQIAWASDIRATAKKSLDVIADELKTTKYDSDTVAIGLSVIDDLFCKSESRYWIDNRHINYDIMWLGNATQRKINEVF